MALTFFVCFEVLTLLQLSLFVTLTASENPQIDSELETILSSGDNYTVLCQGDGPLIWSWPNVTVETTNETSEKYTSIEAVDVLPTNKKFKHASRLIIHNITYPYTGYYRCRDKVVDTEISEIYLYVRDEKHLAVSDASVDTIVVTQHSVALLPCRPTSPDVTVKLSLIGEEEIEGATFNPKTGFNFFVNSVHQEDMYFCTYFWGDTEFDQSVYVKVVPITYFVPKPIIEEISGGHASVGDRLVLKCTVNVISTYVSFSWITPTGAVDPRRMDVSQQMKSPSDNNLVIQTLTINNATLKDKGVYRCNVSDNQDHSSAASLKVMVYAPDEHFINLTEDNNLYTISEQAGKEVRWSISVSGHPEPELLWLNNRNEMILSDRRDKYETGNSSTEACLKIKDISITDYGTYTLVARNGFDTNKLSLFLNVTDKPTVHIENAGFHMVNQKDVVKCVVAAYPEPTISWMFKPCTDNSCKFEKINETNSTVEGFLVTSSVEIQSLDSGFIKCKATNSIGKDEETQQYNVTDVKNGFDIFGFNPDLNIDEERNEVEIGIGEPLNIICGASSEVYKPNMTWIRENKPMGTDDDYRIDKSSTDYTNRLTLHMDVVKSTDAGTYSCKVSELSGRTMYKNMTLKVSKLSPPEIVDTNMRNSLELRLPSGVKFYCNVKGVPKPVVTWYRNNEQFFPSKRTIMSQHNQQVYISSLDFNDEGVYKCSAVNKAGRTSREVDLKFKNKPQNFNIIYFSIIGVLTLVAVLISICMIIKTVNERKLRRELQIAGLANFEKGAIESLNPDLGIDDQAELLPYDKKWELPIENLKLGKQLGSGAFGVVVKGVAKGLVEGEETTTVAVKMVKKHADYTYIKALASELKIMVHLGKHLNVVNLLGACTKNVAKRELLVIVEFCRFGNIQNYLLRHRNNFINQVDPQTNQLDYTIGQEELERTYSVCSNRSNLPSPSMKYAALAFSNSGSPQPHMVDYRGDNYNVTTAKTDITTVSMSPNSEDYHIVSSNNSSVQPEWRSNYHGDYKENTRPICTKDLLAWAFQVSRGMEYLASRKVLHGDLAARNILLADNNVVKICDFGLAKSMYKSDNYKKKGDGPLPVKWMAIESIRDKVFSTQSDVWSFGIVLWEFFSLARTPYPGMEADERLYNKLLDGYRMESPEYSPKEIYKMMLDCWNSKPLSRPTFSKLSERIGSLLEDTIRKHYIDLNDPYLVMNTQRLEDGHSDYLAMLSPPNFENLASPHDYVNDLPPQEDTPGYLTMNSAHIFSPRAEDEPVFSFELSNKSKNKKSEEGKMTELVPMLTNRTPSESDCESPVGPNSFSNPSYHLPPIIEKSDIVKSSDNYVNMPQNKTGLKDGNPFYCKVGKACKDVSYVNCNSRDWESVQL